MIYHQREHFIENKAFRAEKRVQTHCNNFLYVQNTVTDVIRKDFTTYAAINEKLNKKKNTANFTYMRLKRKDHKSVLLTLFNVSNFMLSLINLFSNQSA